MHLNVHAKASLKLNTKYTLHALTICFYEETIGHFKCFAISDQIKIVTKPSLCVSERARARDAQQIWDCVSGGHLNMITEEMCQCKLSFVRYMLRSVRAGPATH